MGRVRAIVARPPNDTIRFEAPARARHCSLGTGRGGLLLQGSSEGNGVVVWLRGSGADSLAGRPGPLLQRGDTVSPRGAMVGVRYMFHEVAHGLSLDSGTVDLREAAHVFTVLARGTGLETMAAGRVALEASFDAVVLEPDSVSCRPTP